MFVSDLFVVYFRAVKFFLFRKGPFAIGGWLIGMPKAVCEIVCL